MDIYNEYLSYTEKEERKAENKKLAMALGLFAILIVYSLCAYSFGYKHALENSAKESLKNTDALKEERKAKTVDCQFTMNKGSSSEITYIGTGEILPYEN